MDMTDYIGTLAGSLTTVAFIPQVIRTWKTRSTQDISLGTFLLFSIGVLMWLWYGIRLHALPVILANAITLVLSGSILVFKILDLRSTRRRLRAAGERPL